MCCPFISGETRKDRIKVQLTQQTEEGRAVMRINEMLDKNPGWNMITLKMEAYNNGVDILSLSTSKLQGIFRKHRKEHRQNTTEAIMASQRSKAGDVILREHCQYNTNIQGGRKNLHLCYLGFSFPTISP